MTNDKSGADSAAVPAVDNSIDFQSLRKKFGAIAVPIWDAVKIYAVQAKHGYKDLEEKLHQLVHNTKSGNEWDDRKGPLDLGIISIRIPTITPKMTSYFLHCCTVSAVAFAWQLLTGTSTKPIIAATAFVLFDPFCKKVSDFKNDFPKSFAVIWGTSWIAMCAGHQLLFSSTTMITNKVFTGQFSAGVSFLVASAVMSYFMMMPLERVKSFIQSISVDTNNNAGQINGGDAEPPVTPVARRLTAEAHAQQTPFAPRTQGRPAAAAPLTASRTTAELQDLNSPAVELSSSITHPKTPYTPVLCFIEGYVIDKFLGYINTQQTQPSGVVNDKSCCERK